MGRNFLPGPPVIPSLTHGAHLIMPPEFQAVVSDLIALIAVAALVLGGEE